MGTRATPSLIRESRPSRCPSPSYSTHPACTWLRSHRTASAATERASGVSQEQKTGGGGSLWLTADDLSTGRYRGATHRPTARPHQPEVLHPTSTPTDSTPSPTILRPDRQHALTSNLLPAGPTHHTSTRCWLRGISVRDAKRLAIINAKNRAVLEKHDGRPTPSTLK